MPAIQRAATQDAPGRTWRGVTPADTDLPDGQCRCLWIGNSGDVEVTDETGNSEVFENVPIGWLEVQAVQVNVAGTTATGIVAVY